jgi:FtsH-binding integral membrane protein
VLASLALGVAIAAAVRPNGIVGGFGQGLGFAVGMVALACGFIIYNTSNIMHHYATDQHVSAALELFASVALLFWYVLRIFMSVRDD